MQFVTGRTYIVGIVAVLLLMSCATSPVTTERQIKRDTGQRIQERPVAVEETERDEPGLAESDIPELIPGETLSEEEGNEQLEAMDGDHQEEDARLASLPREEEVKSLQLFTEILNITESATNRQEVLPQIEDLYYQIIREYPNAPLAQESYWKLITIYVKDYRPPAYDRAESLYHDFTDRYPYSPLKPMVDDELGNSYYKHREWSKLLELAEPAYRDYVFRGKQPRASLMFLYAEAHYNLGNIEEAEKGYRLVSELFPTLLLGVQSKSRLDQIEESQFTEPDLER